MSTRFSDLRLCLRMLRQARPYRRHLVAIALLGLSEAPVALLMPLPLMIAVDSVIGRKPLPAFLSALLPPALATSRSGLLAVVAALVVVFALLKQLQGFGSWVLQLYTGEKLVLGFRARLFRHAQRLSLSYHDSRGIADSLYRIQYDSASMQYVMMQSLLPFVTSAVTLAALLWVTARIDWELAMVALAVSPALFVLAELYRHRVRARWSGIKALESAAMTVVQEVLGALRVVKAFGQEDREQERFVRRAEESLWAQIKVVLMEAGFGMLVALVIAGGTAAVLVIGVWHVQAGLLTLGELLIVMAYIAQLYQPLTTMSRTMTDVQSALASAERAFSLLDHRPDVPEKTGAQRLVRARGAVAFEHVSFSYDRDDSVLDDVCMSIDAGTRVGISGRTGAGKTTLVSLLPRFQDPMAGRITLDGVDLRDYRLADLRNQFAIVLQEPVLFSGSVAENIAYGRPAASEDEILEAARAANVHDFISRLPDGYRTPVGERGMSLSGGERQRISLARAFLKDAPILILDEPTSSVDAGSETLILEALQQLMRGRTTFLISHRLSTLEPCELRLQLAGGRLVPLPVGEPRLPLVGLAVGAES